MNIEPDQRLKEFHITRRARLIIRLMLTPVVLALGVLVFHPHKIVITDVVIVGVFLSILGLWAWTWYGQTSD